MSANAIPVLAGSWGLPGGRAIAVANRAFLRRAVRFLAAEAGVGQFVDIGTGIPQ
jgi:hypothetical protein